MSSPPQSNHPGSPASSYRTDALSFSILSGICGASTGSTGTGVHLSDLGSPRSQAFTESEEDFVLIGAGSNVLSPAAARTFTTPVGGFQLPRLSSSDEGSDDEDKDESGRQSDSSEEHSSSSESDDDIVFRGAMAALGISKMNATAPTPTPTQPRPVPHAQAAPASPTASQTRSARRKASKLRKAARAAASGASSSEESSGTSAIATPGDASFSSQMYEEAVAYITQYLNAPPSNPSPPDRLHFLQSLIIELGLLAKGGTELPTSVKAATRLLKDQVHLNVKQYLAWRKRRVAAYEAFAVPPAQTKNKKAKQQTAQVAAQREVEVRRGLAELQQVLYPSKAALKRSLKVGPSATSGTNGRMPVNVIKKAGLNVFLVTVFR